MAIKNRNDLKSFFVKNAIPTEGNFADLIDSGLNQSVDGIFRPEGEPLSIVAAATQQKRALRLYADYPAANPDWMLSLNPAQDPANAAGTSRAGLGFTDGAGNTRLFIDTATGQVGMGTNAPQAGLDVAGAARANGFRGRYDLALADYRTNNPASNVCLQSPPGDRDAWIYRDVADASSNWGIYHRQIDSAVAGLPMNSIAFVGGGASKLQAYIALGDGSGYFAGPLSIGGDVQLNGKHAFRASDSWLRLNQDMAFTSGVHTPGVFAPMSLNVGGWNSWGNPGNGNANVTGNMYVAGGVVASGLNMGRNGATMAYPSPYESLGTDNASHNLRLYSRLQLFMHAQTGVTISGDGSGNGNGRLGIGIQADRPLHIRPTSQGAIRIDDHSNYAHAFYIHYETNNDTVVFYHQDGRGQFMRSDGGWQQNSDVSLKENVAELSGVLEKVLRLRPVRFDWKGTDDAGLGFVAQEVEPVFPELVAEHTGLDGRPVKGLPYATFGVLAIGALQEMKRQYDERIAALEQQVRDLTKP